MNTQAPTITLAESIADTIASLADQGGQLLGLALETEIVDWCQCRGPQGCTCHEITEAFVTLTFLAQYYGHGWNTATGRAQIGSWDTQGGEVTEWRKCPAMITEVPWAVVEVLKGEGIRVADVETVLSALITSDKWEAPEGF